MAEISARTIVQAVNYANEFRQELGEELIPDLPPSVPNQSAKCVLARAFNFDCKVRPHDQTGWVVLFHSTDGETVEKRANALSRILETEFTIETYGGGNTGILEEYWALVPLPEEIGEIAWAFDNGLLPDKYYEEGTKRNATKF